MKTEKMGCNPNPQCGECANNGECQQLTEDTSPSPEPETEKPPPISSEWGEKYRRAIAVTDGGSSGVDARRAVILPSLAAEPPRAAEVPKDEIAAVAPPPDNNRTSQLDLAALREQWIGGQLPVTSSDEGLGEIEQVPEDLSLHALPVAVMVIGKQLVSAGGGVIGYTNEDPSSSQMRNKVGGGAWHGLNTAPQDALLSPLPSSTFPPDSSLDDLSAMSQESESGRDSGGGDVLSLSLVSASLRNKALQAVKRQLKRYGCTLKAISDILDDRNAALTELEAKLKEREHLLEAEITAVAQLKVEQIPARVLYLVLFLVASFAVLTVLYMTPRGSEVGAFLSTLISPTQSLPTEGDTLYGGSAQVAEDAGEFFATLDASGDSAVEDLPPLVPLAPEEPVYTEPDIFCGEFTPPVSTEDPGVMSIWYGTPEVLAMNAAALEEVAPVYTSDPNDMGIVVYLPDPNDPGIPVYLPDPNDPGIPVQL